ncbi:glycosyltransferase family 2 protein [Rhodosalinus sp. 5P4]|uniref:glycosyltransferase family 2 protein n=1 Tax=Rhodosalinus sp. 5P4 TaxID=3239196 RepID=UPI003524C6D9
MRDVTIVVPVFNAAEDSVACIESLLASDAGSTSILLADDGSRLDVLELLRHRFEGNDNITFVAHFRNRGYTRNLRLVWDTVETQFVCVLNSDTLVPSVWLGPLLAALRENSWLAGVGPVSNAASYQSIPNVHASDGSFSTNDALGHDRRHRDTLNSFLGQRFADLLIDVPVLNGFCTVFRRHAVDRVGGFDDETFTRGYGEENDMCLRLTQSGWRLACMPSIFVHHAKSRSFGTTMRDGLAREAVKRLGRKFGVTVPRELDQQLQTNVELSAMRQSCAFLSAGAPEDFVVADPSDAPSPARCREGTVTLLRLHGPGELTLASSGMDWMEGGDAIDPSFAFSGDRLSVSLPADAAFSLVRETPYSTALGELMLMSCHRPVLLGQWDPDPTVMEHGRSKHLRFRHLFASPREPAPVRA